MSNDININDLENEVKEEFDTDTAFDAEKEYPNDAEEIERSDEDDTSDGDLVTLLTSMAVKEFSLLSQMRGTDRVN